MSQSEENSHTNSPADFSKQLAEAPTSELAIPINETDTENSVTPPTLENDTEIIKVESPGPLSPKTSRMKAAAGNGFSSPPRDRSPGSKGSRCRSITLRQGSRPSPYNNSSSPREEGAPNRAILKRFSLIPREIKMERDPSTIFPSRRKDTNTNINTGKPKIREQEPKEVISEEENPHLARIIKILNQEPEERSEGDLEKLHSLVADATFFNNLEATKGRKNLLKCLSKLSHVYVSKGKTVFAQGEMGTTYYIIIKGKVKLTKKSWVRAEKEELPFEKVQNTEKTEESKAGGSKVEGNKQAEARASQRSLSNSEEDKKQKMKPEHTQQTQNTRQNAQSSKSLIQMLVSSDVTELHEGQTFGEISLLKRKPRGATVTAMENCHFAALEKEDFDEILSQFEEERLEEKLNFLYSIKIFSDWNYNLISTLYYHLRHQKYTWNHTIYKAGEKANRMYIVKKGEITVYRRIKLLETEKVHKMHLMNEKAIYRDVPIAVVGPKEFLGEEDIVNSASYTSTVVCTSAEAELLSITKKDFINHIWDEEGAKYYLKISTKTKLKNFDERTKELEAKWASSKGLLYPSQALVGSHVWAKSQRNVNIYQHLEQHYQTADNGKSRLQGQPMLDNYEELELQFNNSPQISLGKSGSPSILAFLEENRNSVSPPPLRQLSPLKENGSIPRSPLNQRQLSPVKEPVSMPRINIHQGKVGIFSFKEALGNSESIHTLRKATSQISILESSPPKEAPVNQNVWPTDTLSPIRSPNVRSLIFSEKESPSTLLKAQKDPDMTIEDDKFFLEGRSRNSSINTKRGEPVSIIPDPVHVYKKKGLTLNEREILPSIHGDSPKRGQETQRSSPRRVQVRMTDRLEDTTRQRSISRIRLDASNIQNIRAARSQIFESRSIRGLVGSPIMPDSNDFTMEASGFKTRAYDTSRILRGDSERLDESQRVIQQKVQMLGSLRTRMRLDIIKYQGLQKHLDGPDEMKREKITKGLIMKQIDENMQDMKLVFGTKKFTEIRRDELRQYFQKRRNREIMMQPNLVDELAMQYLKSIVPKAETVRLDEGESRKEEHIVDLEALKKNSKRLTPLKGETHRSTSEIPVVHYMRGPRPHINMKIKQQEFTKEVEEEMQRAYKKLYGKLAKKRLQEL